MKWLVKSLASLFALSFMVFVLARLTPADPLTAYYGERAEKMSVAEKETARQELGLDEPLIKQYVSYVEKAWHGDLGMSFQYKKPVLDVIVERIGNTMLLSGLGFLLVGIGALFLGWFCAYYQDRWPDRLLYKLGMLSGCIPEFWLSLVLILVFAVLLHWLPSGGAYDIGQDTVLSRVRHLVLPLSVVVVSHLWYYAYMVRNRMVQESQEDYVLLALGKGLDRKTVLRKHCLRNTLGSYFSLLATGLPHMIGGTYIVEMVFSYPGLGTLCYESVQNGDYHLLMAVCLLTGILMLCGSGLAKFVSERFDWRLRRRDDV